MSFPRYPAYKPSGVAWLGEVPEHWSVGQSRRRFRLRNEPARDEDEQLTASQKHGIIKQADFVESEGRRVVEVIKGQDILKHVEPGDFVISMRSFQGGLEHSRIRGSISSAYVMLAPVKEVIPAYFSWLFKSQPYIQALQSTTNLVRDGQALRFSNFCQVDIPLIPADEQLTIATFLDRETAKIDALIAEQQRLIELLQEKRQAVISHAVTKGLNPDVPMKNSGVEWLGEVPEHWDIAPLKHHWRVTDCKHVTAEFTQEGYPLASIREVQGRWVVLENAKRTTEDFYNLLTEGNRLPEPGDLIFTRNATVGEVAEVPVLIEPFALGQDVVILKKLNPRYSSSYAWNMLKSTATENQLECAMIGSTFRRINVEQIKSLSIPVPPLQEQAAIAAHLEVAREELDRQEQDAQHCIALLQERRAALISAAVTGQIDVRGLVPEAEAA